jgi:hypothetical protein
MNEIILAPCDVISKIKQNSSDMNEIILAPYDVISKIKQNSSDMHEIILAPCDAGYVQSCAGLAAEGPLFLQNSVRTRLKITSVLTRVHISICILYTMLKMLLLPERWN